MLFISLGFSNSEVNNWNEPEALELFNSERDEYGFFTLDLDSTKHTYFYNRSGFDNKFEVDFNIDLPSKQEESQSDILLLRSTNRISDEGDVLPTRSKSVSNGEIGYVSYGTSDFFVSYPRQGSRNRQSAIGKAEIIKRQLVFTTFLDSMECDCFQSMPTVSPDGRTMAFVSNRGNDDNPMDTDIWLANKLSDGTWGYLQRFDLVNTEYVETTPRFIGNKLFFASSGLGGKGMLDLFYVVYENGIWSKPIVFPHNSEFDDLDPYGLSDGGIVFSSSRAGGKGGLDFYLSSPLKDEQLNSVPEISASIKSINTRIIKRTNKRFINKALSLDAKIHDGKIELDGHDLSEIQNVLITSLSKDPNLKIRCEKGQEEHVKEAIASLIEIQESERSHSLLEVGEDKEPSTIWIEESIKEFQYEPKTLSFNLDFENKEITKLDWEAYLMGQSGELLLSKGNSTKVGTISYPLQGNKELEKLNFDQNFALVKLIAKDYNGKSSSDIATFDLEVVKTESISPYMEISEIAVSYFLIVDKDDSPAIVYDKIIKDHKDRLPALQKLSFYSNFEESATRQSVSKLRDNLSAKGLNTDPTDYPTSKLSKLKEADLLGSSESFTDLIIIKLDFAISDSSLR
ncbi:MAG: hypothetical protein Kapaf2KO_20330 [Candidatus Kapaibacteriales bacterium]